MPLVLLAIPVFSTAAGGLLALRFRQSLAVLLGLGAGLLLAAAFLDLLPEAIALGAPLHAIPGSILGVALLSFLGFLGIQMGLDSLSMRWASTERAEDMAHVEEVAIRAPRRTLGRVGAGMLIFHSLRDGMAIGLSYAASHPAGYAVAAGIAAHDLGDGMNTIILATGGERPQAADYLYLAGDCLAPLIGGLLTFWWSFSARTSFLLLAASGGFFVQMATSDFLPAMRSAKQSRRYLFPSVCLGAGLIYLATLLTGSFR